jgi:hypothetical protein
LFSFYVFYVFGNNNLSIVVLTQKILCKKIPNKNRVISRESIIRGAITRTGMKRSEESRKKMSISASNATEKITKPFELLSPTGEIIKGNNLKKFGRDNNINQGGLWKVLNDKCESYKGWKKPNSKFKRKKQEEILNSPLRKKRFFCVKSPSGEIIRGYGISKFCRDNNLCRDFFARLLNKKCKSVKGWTLP